MRKDFTSFCRDNRKYLAGSLLSLLVVTFHFLWTSNYRMDTLAVTMTENYIFDDLDIGRFGLVLLRAVTGLMDYNPYYCVILTWLGMGSACVMMSFLFWRLTGQEKAGPWLRAAYSLIPVLMFLHPNWTEQLYFTYQAFAVTGAVFFLLLAEYLLIRYGETKRKRCFAAGTALLFLSFSVYQTFVPFFLAVAAACLLLQMLGGSGGCLKQSTGKRPEDGGENDSESRSDNSLMKLFPEFLRHVLMFAVALILYFVINEAVTAVFAENTAYLSTQVLWGKVPIAGVISSIFQGIRSIVVAAGSEDTLAYTVSMLGSLILLILWLKIKKFCAGHAAAAVFCWAGLELTPFAMIFVTGSRSATRSELVTPFVVAVNLFLMLELSGRIREETGCILQKAADCASDITETAAGKPRARTDWKRIPLAISVVTAFLLSMTQLSVTLRLYYTDDVRNLQDQVFAQQIMSAINEAQVDTAKPVIFIGQQNITLNTSCLRGQAIGTSMFRYHETLLSSNTLLHDYFRGLGMALSMPEEGSELYALAEEEAVDMESWPTDGCIRDCGEYIIVKLSDDPYWEAEILTGGLEEADAAVDEYSDTAICGISGITTEEGEVTLSGWLLFEGTDSLDVVNTVYLHDMSENIWYRVNSACDERREIASLYSDGDINYDACGFLAKLSVRLFLSNPTTNYEVVIESETDSGIYYTRTNVILNARVLRLEEG